MCLGFPTIFGRGLRLVLRQAGTLSAQKATLRAAAAGNTTLLAAIDNVVTPPPESPTMRTHRLRRAADEARRKAQRTSDEKSWIKFQAALRKDPQQLCKPAKLKSWKAGIFRLNPLSKWLRRRTGADLERAVCEWRLLEEGFNRDVAEAYCDGRMRL